jgi:hypothetical protein
VITALSSSPICDDTTAVPSEADGAAEIPEPTLRADFVAKVGFEVVLTASADF